jgi:hypothetical protein
MDSEGATESELAASEPAARTESDSMFAVGTVAPSLQSSAAPEIDLSPNLSPSSEPRELQPPHVHAPVPPPSPPAPNSPPWPDQVSAVAASFYEWLSRPRVRLTLTGVILLLIGGLIMTNSVWTLPLVIVGLLMVVIGWIGCRLDGRFAIEWGETGTQLEFRAKLRAAHPARPALIRMASSSHELARTLEPEAEDAQIIDGEAHTVEIDVAELEALIAAVETTQAGSAQTDGSRQGTHNIQVARNGRSHGAAPRAEQ